MDRTLLAIQESNDSDTIEQQGFNEYREQMFEEYGQKDVFQCISLMYELDEKLKRKAEYLHFNTAGEIEANDVSDRVDMTEEQRKNTRPDIDRKDVVFADSQTVSLYYVGKNANGYEVYETSEKIKNLSYKERQKVFLQMMEQEYRGRTAKFERNGHTYYALFDYCDVNKNIYGDNKSDLKGWKAKINVGADGDIFQLVENTRYDGSKQEIGKQTKSHKGVNYWDYYVKTVQIDNTVFDLIANIRKKSDGAFVYSLQLNENKKIEASPSLGLPKGSLNRMLNASNNSIPNETGNVNGKSSADVTYDGSKADIRFHKKINTDYSDLSKLDSESIKGYNDRGWARGLLTKEDNALLNRRLGEIFHENSKYVRTTLADGTVVLDLNNKMLLVSGNFDNPVINSVIAINAVNDTDAEFVREDIRYELQNARFDKDTFTAFLKSSESIYGKETVRTFDRYDYQYIKGRRDTGARAALPDTWQNYGYTTSEQDGRGVSSETKNGLPEGVIKYQYKAYAMPTDYDMLVQHIQEEVLDRSNPESVKKLLLKVSDMKISDKKLEGAVIRTLREYGVYGKLEKSTAEEIVAVLKAATHPGVEGKKTTSDLQSIITQALQRTPYEFNPNAGTYQDVVDVLRSYEGKRVYLSESQEAHVREQDYDLRWPA